MKKVVMRVELTFEVPDDIEVEGLTVEFDEFDIRDGQNRNVRANNWSHETVSVEEVAG